MNKLEPIYKKIIESIKEAGLPAFAVIDFDNTCVLKDITEATLAYLTENNLFKDKNLIAGKFENYGKAVYERYYKILNEGKIKEAYELSAKILSGFSAGEIALLVKKVLKFEKGLEPRKEIVELINFLKNNKVAVWIVSASPELLVRGVMEHFNIKANLIGTRNPIVGSKFIAELEKPTPMFEGKVDCIKKFISPEKQPLLGVGDSVNDLFMLEYCNMKVVVDRQNSLAKKARENNWFLI